jgi:hypothetical protein
MPSSKNLKATILICDDVRQEVGGKVSVMGLFREAGVGELPAVLARFCVVLLMKGGSGSQDLSLELAPPSGERRPLWRKKVIFRGPDQDQIEVVGLWNLQLSQLGTHKVVLSSEGDSLEETFLEVVKAGR